MQNDKIQKCREKLFTGVIADTLDSIGYHKQVLEPGIFALDPDIKICGLARIGLYMPIYHDDENINVYEHEIALVDSLKKNEVAVLLCNQDKNIAPWGELLSTRASYLGAAGCLTDGCVRDSTLIREMKFPVYSSGTNPVDTKYRGKMMMADVPGKISGVDIEKGDLVFGDRDGVLIVPSKILDEVVEKALIKIDSENTVREELRSGNTLTDVFAKHKIL